MCRRYFGKDIISYWSWDGIATLLAPTAEASFGLCLDWFEEYLALHPAAGDKRGYEVEDRFVRFLGMARHRPALIFGNSRGPWEVQAYLHGYRRACMIEGRQPSPALAALLELGQDLARDIGLSVEANVSWARAVGFTRSGFTGRVEPDWFSKLLHELEEKQGVSIPPVEGTGLSPDRGAT
ncbi:MAG TPA: hypothetical protein DEA08_21430 [Planctomycetes bacterium]|nr:hypothetical protein [Planctomycetota bacterium]